jgi:nucleoside-diphosphate-sugar epimerase
VTAVWRHGAERGADVGKVLLFGASGFIGAHVRAALTADPRVGAVVCPGRDRHDLIDGDPADLVRLLRQESPDAVVSCVGRLTGTDAELIRGNTLVTAELLAAVAAAAPNARLVRLGSAGEYGVVPHGRSVAEDDRTEPVAAYGVSHLAATRLVELAPVDAVSVRVFNPIGAGLSEENLLGRAARRLREAVATGAAEVVMGPLGAYRDFVDVRDVAALVRSLVLAPDLRHRVFNAGSGRAVTAREAVGMLADRAGFTGEIRTEGSGPRRSATVDWIQADISRARDELDWAPVHDLGSSIKDIWQGGVPG